MRLDAHGDDAENNQSDHHGTLDIICNERDTETSQSLFERHQSIAVRMGTSILTCVDCRDSAFDDDHRKTIQSSQGSDNLL